MRLKSLIDILVCALLLVSGLCHAQDDGALKLWYRQPAGAWTQALPVGNGRLAAMVFGTVRKEHIQLNEDTVWSGEKRDRSYPEAPKALAQIRRLLVEGHPAQAQALADKTMISIPRALPVYETLGDLWLDFGSGPDATDYRRELDLDTGIVTVRYTAGGVHYVREVFTSAPASHCLIVRLTADKPGSISFQATLSRPADASTESAAGRLIMTGQALPKRAAGENNTGVRFRSEVKATVSGGKLESAGDHLEVSGADSVTLTIVAETEIREKDLAGACARDFAAASRAHDALRSEHIADHRHFFRRVRLELPVDSAARAPAHRRASRARAERRGRQRPVCSLFPVRKVSTHREQPAWKHGGESTGKMER